MHVCKHTLHIHTALSQKCLNAQIVLCSVSRGTYIYFGDRLAPFNGQIVNNQTKLEADPEKRPVLKTVCRTTSTEVRLYQLFVHYKHQNIPLNWSEASSVGWDRWAPILSILEMSDDRPRSQITPTLPQTQLCLQQQADIAMPKSGGYFSQTSYLLFLFNLKNTTKWACCLVENGFN